MAYCNSKLFRSIFCLLVFLGFCLLSGCEKEYAGDILNYGPEVEKMSVVPAYAGQALKAAGGREVWTKTTKLDFDAVVIFYQPDASTYLTEQHYEFFPWSNSLRVSGTEPIGSFVWQLSKGAFQELTSPCIMPSGTTSPVDVPSQCFAEAMLNITTASIRLLDESVQFVPSPGAVKKEGSWYYPLERSNFQTEQLKTNSCWPSAVFYQNKDNYLIDTIWFKDSSGRAKSLLVRGYDYREIKGKSVVVPTKIEIFKTDVTGSVQKRLATINFK